MKHAFAISVLKGRLEELDKLIQCDDFDEMKGCLTNYVDITEAIELLESAESDGEIVHDTIRVPIKMLREDVEVKRETITVPFRLIREVTPSPERE